MPSVSIRAVWAAMLLCVSLNFSASAWADSITIQVEVVDEAGQSIADADVTLVGLYQRPPVPHESPGAATLPHQGNGRYLVTLDERAVPIRHHREAVLMVHSQGRQLQVLPLPLARFQSNVPISIALHSSTPQSLRVVDSQGEPLAGIVIRPAVWHRHLIPWSTQRFAAPPTNTDGITEADWVDSANLAMVYATGEEIGNQRLQVSATDDGSLQVTVLPTFEASGRWSAPLAMDEHPSFSDASVTALVSDSGYSITEPTDMSYCWATTSPRPDGTLSPVRLCAGQMVVKIDLPSSIPLTHRFNIRDIQPGEAVELDLAEAIRVRGSVVDDRSGRPLPGIAIYVGSMANQDQATDADGSFQLWFHPEDHISYYAMDVTGKYTTADAFFIYPQERPVDGVLDLEPTRLIAASTATGSVVDPHGNPVAGAEVECQFSKERFTETVTLFSDADGRFTFRGVLENSTVTVRGMTDAMMTAEPLSVQLAPDANVELRVEPRHALRIRGHVTGADGRPLAGAAVTVRTPQVHEQESYSGEGATAVPLFQRGSAIVTDDQGRFVTPPIIDWQRRLSLAVRAPGHRTLQTYWTDAEPLGNAEKDWDVGQLQLLPQWPTVTERVEVVDTQSGQPLEDARVVCRGVYVDLQRQRTDAEGVASFQLRDTTAVFAFAHDGYHPEFKVRRSGEPLRRVELRPLDAPPPDRSPVRLDRDQRIQLARRLMDRVDPPTSTDSLHRHATYYRGLAFADFDAAIAGVQAADVSSETRQELTRMISNMEWMDKEQLAAVEGLSDQESLQGLVRRADLTESPDEKLELYGEAILLAEQMTGDMALTMAGYLAQKLYAVGEGETAAQLLQDAFDDHEKLRLILEKNERQKETGIARIFLPLYAVVAPKTAVNLIRLTASVDEVPVLETIAIRCAVEYGANDPESLCRELGIEALSARAMTSRYHLTVKHRSLQRGLALAQKCPDEPGKADFLFELAKTSDADRQQKIELAQAALQILRSEHDGPSYLDPGHWLAERVETVAAWDRELSQAYAFEAFWLRPQERLITPFHETSTLARQIATFDSSVARALIEPCFDDWSWLFDQRDFWVMFAQLPPLHAAAAIDADWTVQLVDDLFRRHLDAHPSRRADVVSGVIRSLTE